jgi:hypothetical protein
MVIVINFCHSKSLCRHGLGECIGFQFLLRLPPQLNIPAVFFEEVLNSLFLSQHPKKGQRASSSSHGPHCVDQQRTHHHERGYRQHQSSHQSQRVNGGAASHGCARDGFPKTGRLQHVQPATMVGRCGLVCRIVAVLRRGCFPGQSPSQLLLTRRRGDRDPSVARPAISNHNGDLRRDRSQPTREGDDGGTGPEAEGSSGSGGSLQAVCRLICQAQRGPEPSAHDSSGGEGDHAANVTDSD